jgi:predicted nucleic acid-binding protein
MPAENAFLDTNLLVYLLRPDDGRSRLLDPLMMPGGVISVQVLNELVSVSRRKFGLGAQAIAPFLDRIKATFSVVPITLAVHERGLTLLARHNFSVYDAMIVAAALEAGCDTLYTEDMQDGLVVDGSLTIRNPFRAT